MTRILTIEDDSVTAKEIVAELTSHGLEVDWVANGREGLVRAVSGDGESLFVNVIAFDEGPCAALLALDDGDSVALAGSLTPKAWLDREGQPRAAVDMVASQVLTTYQVKRKREAVTTPKPCTTPAAAVAKMESMFGAAGRFDDEGIV